MSRLPNRKEGGDPILANDFNRLVEAVARQLRGGFGVQVSGDDVVGLDKRSLEVESRFGRKGRRRIVAKVTEAVGDGEHKAVEQVWDDSADDWKDAPEGRTWDGTDLPTIFSLDGSSVSVDDLIVVERTPKFDAENKMVGWQWWFEVGGGGGGASLQRLIVKEIFDDHLRCRTWDGLNEGTTDIFVAKPFKLRHDVNNYDTIASLSTTDSQTVDVFEFTTTETWKVTPPYEVDNEIYSITVSGTGVDPGSGELTIIDVNLDGRAWARV